MSDDPAVLDRRRAIINGACARVKGYVDSIEAITPFVVAQLEERKSKLEHYWCDYDSVQAKLELLDESESNHRVTLEEAFFFIIGKSPRVTRIRKFAARRGRTFSGVFKRNSIKIFQLRKVAEIKFANVLGPIRRMALVFRYIQCRHTL